MGSKNCSLATLNDECGVPEYYVKVEEKWLENMLTESAISLLGEPLSVTVLEV